MASSEIAKSFACSRDAASTLPQTLAFLLL
jgi:hypothetical protein